MARIFVFLQMCALTFAVPNIPKGLEEDINWYCTTICEGSGGKAKFVIDGPICYCDVDESVSSNSIKLMHKLAKTTGMNFWIRNASSIITKREVDEPKFPFTKLTPLRFKLRSRILKDDDKRLNLLGEENPLKKDLFQPKNTLQASLTKATLKNVEGRINSLLDRLEKYPYDHPRVVTEVDFFINSLKQISNSGISSRMAGQGSSNIFENMRHSLLGPKKNLLGNAAPTTEASPVKEDATKDDQEDEEVSTVAVPKGIITQPKELFGDADNP